MRTQQAFHPLTVMLPVKVRQFPVIVVIPYCALMFVGMLADDATTHSGNFHAALLAVQESAKRSETALKSTINVIADIERPNSVNLSADTEADTRLLLDTTPELVSLPWEAPVVTIQSSPLAAGASGSGSPLASPVVDSKLASVTVVSPVAEHTPVDMPASEVDVVAAPSPITGMASLATDTQPVTELMHAVGVSNVSTTSGITETLPPAAPVARVPSLIAKGALIFEPLAMDDDIAAFASPPLLRTPSKTALLLNQAGHGSAQSPGRLHPTVPATHSRTLSHPVSPMDAAQPSVATPSRVSPVPSFNQQIAVGTGIAIVPDRIKATRTLSSSLLHPPAPASPSPLSPQMVVSQSSLSLLVQHTAPVVASPNIVAPVPTAAPEVVLPGDSQSFLVPHIQGVGVPAKHPSPTPSALSTEKGESRQFFWGSELRQSVLSSRRDSSRLTDASDALDRHAHPSVTTLASTDGGSALDMSLSSDGSEHGLQLLPLSDTLLSVDTHDASIAVVPDEPTADAGPAMVVDEIRSARVNSAQPDADAIQEPVEDDSTTAPSVEVDVLTSNSMAEAPQSAMDTGQLPQRALRVPIRNVQRVIAVTKAIPQYDDSKF